MALIDFVRRYSDLSTDDGFQFEFFCDRCGSGYQTRFQTAIAGPVSGALQSAASLFDALSGADEVGEPVRPPAREDARDRAFVRAVEEMRPRFRQCRRCGQWVDQACWNAARGLCLDCAPRPGVGFSAAVAGTVPFSHRSEYRMQLKLGEFIHYGLYFARARLLGSRRPLVGGINITSYCNLECAHCVYATGLMPREHLTRAQIESMCATFRRQGVRVLFLQGGEPTLWHDGDYRFNDLVRDARKQFSQVACVTNAILPIDNPCDLVWISVDGSPEVHDRVRGAGSYEKMAENVAASPNPNLYANITLSKLNVDDLEACVEHIVLDMPRFKAISVNFEIPYPGVEEHTLDYDQRAKAVDRIIDLRRQGFPIMNSPAALRLMLKPGWNTTHWLISLAHPNGMVVEGCGARNVDPEICKSCGYGVMAEVQAIWRGNPGAILEAFRLFRVVSGA